MTRLTLAYGPPGSGKTEALIAIIKHVYSLTGKRARVVCGDGSLANYTDSGLVEAGILDLCDYSAMPWPSTTTNRLAEGWWPTAQDDDGVWRTKDVNLKDFQHTPADELAKFGVFGFEALSTMIRDYLMGNREGGMAWQSARGIKIGQDSPYSIKDAMIKSVDGRGGVLYEPNTGTGEVFGGNPLSHFSVAQTHALGVISRSKTLPGWVWWNSHEKLGKEEKKEGKGDNVTTIATGDIAIGPESAGNAQALSLPRLFSDTLHFTVARKVVTNVTDATTAKNTKDVQDQYRLYFRDHYDPDGVVTQVPYKAIVRCAKPELLPKTGYFAGAKGEAVLALYKTIGDAKRLAQKEAEELKAKVETRLAAAAEEVKVA